MTATYPHSVSTGRYTIDQLEGEHCARCGQPFQIGEKSRPSDRIDGFQLFTHAKCTNGGAR